MALPIDNAGQDSDKYLIAGLGNPGRQYADNRHNLGFRVVDQLARAYNIPMQRVQSQAIVGQGRLGNHSIVLAKPQTYMNLSGSSVAALARFYKLPASNVLVVYDELDLPLGTIRLREKGGAGGHNGMRSIIQHLGDEFPRLRLGIGRPPGQMPAAAYVLQDFGRDDQPVVDELLDHSLQAIEVFVRDGIQLAMSRFNGPVGNAQDDAGESR
jgi:PTH1 family peptidyl-tRNA hydrolase